MKLIFSLLILMFSQLLFAQEVKIEINPKKPVAGEVFQAYFRIFTDQDDEPSINFSPNNLEVAGKSNQGVSTRTVYANGKLTVTREITIVYDLVASRPGPASLREITIQIGSKNIRQQAVSITVLKEAEVTPDIFVMADVPKKELFLGEGVVVRYYLYSRVDVSNLDVKKYPKLNNFLKRFLQEQERPERVSVDGQIFLRTPIYAAKLYPEKVGELTIDGLQLSATFAASRPGDPFGAFGFNREFRTKSLNSETIKVQVRPLPEPIPPHFTGLVGKHEFQLQLGKTRLIVNEPLEVKLTVSGVGALENLEAPELLKNSSLEEFETNGDLKISSPEYATKVFDYTFLAKENLNLPGADVTLSYFDPDTEKFIPTTLNVPEIVVAGGQGNKVKDEEPKSKDDEEKTTKKKTIPVTINTDLSGPVTQVSQEWRSWLPTANLVLGILAVLLSLGWMIKNKSLPSFSSQKNIPATFKKGQFELSAFVKWIGPLIKETGKSPIAIIKESPLPEESKTYFIDLLSSNDYKEYSQKKSDLVYKFDSKHFRHLGNYIESVRNENTV